MVLGLPSPMGPAPSRCAGGLASRGWRCNLIPRLDVCHTGVPKPVGGRLRWGGGSGP